MAAARSSNRSSASSDTETHEVYLPCIYCIYRQFIRHPKFVYLISDSRLNGDIAKLLTGPQHIGLTRHPEMRLHQQNRKEGYLTGAKPTNLHGPFWQQELIIGPFYTMGREFKLEWRQSARGMESRYRHAYEMVCKWNKKEDFIQINHPRWDSVGKEDVKKCLDSIMCISSEDESESDACPESRNSISHKVRRLALSNGRKLQIFCRDIRLAASVFGVRINDDTPNATMMQMDHGVAESMRSAFPRLHEKLEDDDSDEDDADVEKEEEDDDDAMMSADEDEA